MATFFRGIASFVFFDDLPQLVKISFMSFFSVDKSLKIYFIALVLILPSGNKKRYLM